MSDNRRQSGFSLIEALLATGILGVGLVLIAMVFPVGIKLTSVATERTIGTVAANEAFAKVRLYGVRDFNYWPSAKIAQSTNNPVYAPNWANAAYDTCDNFLYTAEWMHTAGIDGLLGTQDDTFTNLDATWDEFFYPSFVSTAAKDRNYHWSALCRRAGLDEIQVTVFITRKIAAGMLYYNWDYKPGTNSYIQGTNSLPSPVPVYLQYEYDAGSPDPAARKALVVLSGSGNEIWDAVSGMMNTVFGFFGNSVTLVEDRTGNIYDVLEYKDADNDGLKETLVLTNEWRWEGYETTPTPPAGTQILKFWVVPPGIGSTRNPCVGIVQKTLKAEF